MLGLPLTRRAYPTSLGAVVLLLCFAWLLASCGAPTTGRPNAKANPSSTSLPTATATSVSPVSTVYAGSDHVGIYAWQAQTGVLVWRYPASSTGLYPPILAAAGVVYFADTLPGPASPGPGIGRIVALRASDHTMLWHADMDAGDSASVFTLSDGVIYAASGAISNPTAKLYAIRTSDGAVLWKSPVGGVHTSAGISISGGVLYVSIYSFHPTTPNDTLMALRASDGAVLWKRSMGAYVYSTPLISGDTIYLGTSTPDNAIYALRAGDGSVIWRHATEDGRPADGKPVLAGGMLFIGPGEIYALDAATGALVWRRLLGMFGGGSPIVVNGVLYVGSSSGFAALHTGDGTPIWQHNITAGVFSDPVVVGDIVYFGSYDHNMYALRTGDGSGVWTYAAGASIGSPSALG